jgi:hypothetical protein
MFQRVQTCLSVYLTRIQRVYYALLKREKHFRKNAYLF